jgi:phenylpropionate dioxygenase-like ring-hydroxylating dioxygenase large terminal subunit
MSAPPTLSDPLLLDDWHPVARSSELKEGGLATARLLGEDLVLWRTGGRPNAWQDLCVHRGSRLSLGKVDGERLVCAYHGWTYDAGGRCVLMPAHPEQEPPPKARVRVYRTVEKYGLVWASLGSPEKGVPVFEEWDDPAFRKVSCGPYLYKASAPRAVENFLDVAHFPFVHAGLLGDEAHARIEDYTVESGPDGVTARNVVVWQPDPDGTGKGRTVNYTYRVLRPLTAYLVKTFDQGKFAIQVNVTPVDEGNSVAWMCLALDYATDESDEALRAFQDRITGQDIPVVESQRPEKLPLDLQAELHLRSDRIAVAYRKWLKQLGLAFGTS